MKRLLPYRITIIYKSGAKVRCTCRAFSWKQSDDGSFRFEWEKMHPSPIMFGADEVAAVYQGWT